MGPHPEGVKTGSEGRPYLSWLDDRPPTAALRPDYFVGAVT